MSKPIATCRPYSLTLPNGRVVRTRLEWWLDEKGLPETNSVDINPMTGEVYFYTRLRLTIDYLIDLADDLRTIRKALDGEE